MFASPFFTSGRASILPVDRHERRTAHREFADAAHAMDHGDHRIVPRRRIGDGVRLQAGVRVQRHSRFCFRRWCISHLRVAKGFRASRGRSQRSDLTEDKVARPWHEYIEGLRYMRSSPLILASDWSRSAGPPAAARRKSCSACLAKSCFIADPPASASSGDSRASAWSCGALVAHRIGERSASTATSARFRSCYVIHGGSYVLFSQAPTFAAALLFIALIPRGRGRQLRAEFLAASASRFR